MGPANANAPANPHAAAWIEASRRGSVRAQLEAIYAEMGQRIAERGPACWASGRCCHFEAHGHRLYVTGLEAAYTLVSAGVERRIDVGSVEAARAAGNCPFQRENACSVHTIKPMACRVYFCDRSAQQWQQDLSEAMHRRIVELHEREGIPYVYAEWRGLLETLLVAGAMSVGVDSAVGPEGGGVDRDRSCIRTSSENAPPSGLTIRGNSLG